jgi:hypothetical protein
MTSAENASPSPHGQMPPWKRHHLKWPLVPEFATPSFSELKIPIEFLEATVVIPTKAEHGTGKGKNLIDCLNGFLRGQIQYQ